MGPWREVVPGGERQLDEELAYDLATGVVTGSPYAEELLRAVDGERIALIAVCAVTAVMPVSVLGEPERELPALAAAVAAGRDSCP